LKSSRQKRAMTSFLRGGMKPRADGVAAFVTAEAAISAPCVVVGFVFEVAAPVDPDPCDATVADVVEDFLVAVFPDDEPVPAEEPCMVFAAVDGALLVAVSAAFAVLCDAAADDDPESAGVELSASAGGDEVADAAAVAAGLVSVAGFDAVCAVPELEGGVAVVVTALTAC
jgi:hypothetical protein